MIYGRIRQGLPPTISVAYISGSKPEREFVKGEWANSGDHLFRLSRELSTLETPKLIRLASARPDILVFTTGTPNLPSEELIPSLHQIRRFFPNTPVVVRTELSENHPDIQQAVDTMGVSIVDDRLDLDVLVDVLEQVNDGEQVVRYCESEGELERYNYWKEQFRQESVPSRRERF